MAKNDAGSVRVVAGGDVPWLPRVIERSRMVDGQPPFSDGSLVELATGARTFFAIDESAIALVTFAAVAEAEFVVDPDARRHGLGTAILEALIAQSESQSGGTLLVWAHGDHPGARALAASHGFEAVRTLLHLRAEVADTASAPGSAPEAARNTETISSFRPGTDDAEWLVLNALVFAEHPEQGGVTQTDLDVILTEPWFEADDFLLLRSGDGTLIGYCWLKVETDGDSDNENGNSNGNGNGEFYVVGVHPNNAGQGLGRVLVEAGLERLRARGIRSAHLYVEAENLAAVHLYRSYGFVDDTIDVQYARTRSLSS
jgi:mycothiol synthase